MPAIVLTTLNARYSHASLGLRCLRANLGALRDISVIREFVISDDPQRVAEALLEDQPHVVGIGVYIWNLRQSEQVVQILKAVQPTLKVIIGGPEVSFGTEHTVLGQLADVVINGEGDGVIENICGDLLANRTVPAVVDGGLPKLADIELPYGEYTDEDIKQRIIYVEASRGCPFTCEFCLSSLDTGVRAFDTDRFLAAMADLVDRGCRTFKFVDRTFNLKPSTCQKILGFFLDRWARDDQGELIPPLTERQMDQGGQRNEAFFLHFEMVPDRLPDAIKDLVTQFPAGAIQFEVGIQSFTPVVGENIRRRMNVEQTEANLAWLRNSGLIHVHADLIVGLPGETPETFAVSFDRLYDLAPGEIQIGILKLLRGTPIERHIECFDMAFNPEPPYDLLASRDFPFAEMQRFKRFARYYEIFVNSGRFPRTMALLIKTAPQASPCAALLAFSERMWQLLGRVHAIAKPRQYDLLLDDLLGLGVTDELAHETLAQDFLATGTSRGLPERLRPTADRLRQSVGV